MAAYRVRIYPAAERDLQRVIDGLDALPPETALAYYDVLAEEISGLSDRPERHPHPKDLALTAKGYRCLAVKDHLVYYVVSGDTVQIRRILYARRNYLALL